jgi:hypothetical protein
MLRLAGGKDDGIRALMGQRHPICLSENSQPSL